MARLHEHQGKSLLADNGIAVPQGGPAKSAKEAQSLAEEIAAPVVVKGQAWVTGRAGMGAIRFPDSPKTTAEAASEILGMQIKGFVIDTVLIEEKLAIEREFYAGVIIDDQSQAPMKRYISGILVYHF